MRRGSIPLAPILISILVIAIFIGVLYVAWPKREANNNANTTNQITNAAGDNTNTSNTNTHIIVSNTNEDRTLITE